MRNLLAVRTVNAPAVQGISNMPRIILLVEFFPAILGLRKLILAAVLIPMAALVAAQT
jgi:hypothetical protein